MQHPIGTFNLPLALTTLSLLWALPSVAQIAEKQDAWSIPPNAAIAELLAQRMSSSVGVVVGVIERGERRIVVHGKSGAWDERPLDGDSVFQIGSITKVFTGLLLADMARRGECNVDDPAAKYLPPGVRMPQRGRPITLLDLSKHLSALPSMPTNFSLSAKPNPYEAYTVEQLYESCTGTRAARKATAPPSYSIRRAIPAWSY